VSSDTHSDCRQLLLTHRVYPVCVCVCVVVQRGCDQYQLAGLLRQLLSRHPSIHAEPVRQLTAWSQEVPSRVSYWPTDTLTHWPTNTLTYWPADVVLGPWSSFSPCVTSVCLSAWRLVESIYCNSKNTHNCNVCTVLNAVSWDSCWQLLACHD